MNNQYFIDNFSTILNSYKDAICTRISDTYGIDKRELLSVCDVANSPEKTTIKTTPIRSGQPKKKQNKCIYVFMKGCKKGQECGVGVPIGSRYCAKHSTKERKLKDTIQPEPHTEQHNNSILDCLNKALLKNPSPKNSEVDTETEFEVESDVESDVDVASDTSAEYQITKNKYGNYMDEDTGFVFSDDSTVYGKQDMTTGQIVELTEDEIIIVESCGWEYVPH